MAKVFNNFDLLISVVKLHEFYVQTFRVRNQNNGKAFMNEFSAVPTPKFNRVICFRSTIDSLVDQIPDVAVRITIIATTTYSDGIFV